MGDGVRSGVFLVWQGVKGEVHHLLTLTRHTITQYASKEDQEDTVQMLVSSLYHRVDRWVCIFLICILKVPVSC